MTKSVRVDFETAKSPIIMVGLFCLLCLILGCRKQTDPKDVSILFWTALFENKGDEAKQYSLVKPEFVFDKKFLNAHLQTGKVEINYDQATVETFIIRESAARSLSFTTYLTRVQKNDHWKVDYSRTAKNIKKKESKSFFAALRQIASNAKTLSKEELLPLAKDNGQSVLTEIANWLEKLLNQLLDDHEKQ